MVRKAWLSAGRLVVIGLTGWMSCGGVLPSEVIVPIQVTGYVLPAATAAAGDGGPTTEHQIEFKLRGAYVGSVCLTSDFTIRTKDTTSYCSGWKGNNYSWSTKIPYQVGDRIYAKVSIKLGQSKGDIDVTDAKSCVLSGTVQAAKFDCDAPLGKDAASVAPPSVAPFEPANALGPDGQRADLSLLNLLSWCVSAAGVAGILIVGMNLALQLRRGDIGEMSENWRGFAIVLISCVLAMAAGPVIETLNLPLP